MKQSLGERIQLPAFVPLALVTGALISTVLLHYSEPGFGPGQHGELTAHGLAIAGHTTLDRGLFLSCEMTMRDDGSVAYRPYNRFPPLAFLLIRWATLPFEGQLAMQIGVARSLMLVFYILAALTGFASIARLTHDRWVAAAATLFAFSSPLMLYYSDMVFNDVPALFGVLLAFYGLTLHSQEGRLKPCLAAVCTAVALGWQALALGLGYAVCRGVMLLARTRSLRQSLRGGHVLIGGLALCTAGLILTVCFVSEYIVVGGPIVELPSFVRMLDRFGVHGVAGVLKDPVYEHLLSPTTFLSTQLRSVGRMCVPACFYSGDPVDPAWRVYEFAPRGVVWSDLGNNLLVALGGAAGVVAVVLALRRKHRAAWLSLVLAGPFWAAPMRYFVALHEFQSLYYVGIPLVGYALALSAGGRRIRCLNVVAACAGALVFTASVATANLEKARRASVGSARRTLEFQTARDQIGQGKRLYVDGSLEGLGGQRHAWTFYLAGNYFQPTPEGVDFVLREDGEAGRLTVIPTAPEEQRLAEMRVRYAAQRDMVQLVRNGSFESGMVPRGGLTLSLRGQGRLLEPLDWTLHVADEDDLDCVPYETSRVDGRFAVRLTRSEAHAENASLSQSVSVLKGRRYRLEFAVKTFSGALNEVRLRNAEDASLTLLTNVADRLWTLRSVEFDADRSYTELDLLWRYWQTGDVLVDVVALYDIGEALGGEPREEPVTLPETPPVAGQGRLGEDPA